MIDIIATSGVFCVSNSSNLCCSFRILLITPGAAARFNWVSFGSFGCMIDWFCLGSGGTCAVGSRVSLAWVTDQRWGGWACRMGSWRYSLSLKQWHWYSSKKCKCMNRIKVAVGKLSVWETHMISEYIHLQHGVVLALLCTQDFQ